MTSFFLYPKAINVPFCTLNSSTILVIVVMETSAATKKKRIGKIIDKALMESQFPLKLKMAALSFFVSVMIFPFFKSFTCSLASSKSSLAFSKSTFASSSFG